MKRTVILIAILGAFFATTSSAQTSHKDWVAYDQPVIAFTHVIIVDGTGAQPKYDQTLVIKKGRITKLGPASKIDVPDSATVIKARGKTLLPGFVMMHEHLFYPTRLRPHVFYTPMLYSFPPLYLAGGETTIRTTGSMMPYADLNVRNAIEAGKRIGPDIHVTGPYLNGAQSLTVEMHELTGPATPDVR